jgi:hypothetical protein
MAKVSEKYRTTKKPAFGKTGCGVYSYYISELGSKVFFEPFICPIQKC